jgi:N-acetylglucosaminyl-diphospho-decaprenol L-rhamnosyltransferase
MTDLVPSTLRSDLDLTVIVVSFNTRELTLTSLETLFETTRATRFRCIVYDNASADGSAEAIAAAFPQVEVIAADRNIGFAAANNVVAQTATTPYLLLLNPDTEVHEGAIDRLMDFARARPEAGIWGGRTVFPDGSLNIASCWGQITPWSLFTRATGLSSIFRSSEFFNPEGIGGWQRDSVRDVDIVVGCFLLIKTDLWRDLGGFDLRYYMYGEEADLCLRAKTRGFQPMITPDAEIMHLVGASTTVRADKSVLVLKARATLIRDHWSRGLVPLGLALMWLWAGLRRAGTAPLGLSRTQSHKTRAQLWKTIWTRRREWLSGY